MSERSIDLDSIDREATQIGQRGQAPTEFIEQKTYIKPLEGEHDIDCGFGSRPGFGSRSIQARRSEAAQLRWRERP
jgi:hypothetical protein